MLLKMQIMLVPRESQKVEFSYQHFPLNISKLSKKNSISIFYTVRLEENKKDLKNALFFYEKGQVNMA